MYSWPIPLVEAVGEAALDALTGSSSHSSHSSSSSSSPAEGDGVAAAIERVGEGAWLTADGRGVATGTGETLAGWATDHVQTQPVVAGAEL